MKKTNSIKELLALDKDIDLLDAEVLLAHVLGVDREYLISHSDEIVEDSLLELYAAYLARVKEGEPVAYITGEKEFYGFNLYVDDRVLVPRPETELVVDKVLDYIRNYVGERESFRILDLGTGSGNMPVAIVGAALEDFPELFVEVDALDISDDALDVARMNVEQYGFEDRINLFQSDLLMSIDNAERYDIIVANLPYIGEKTNHFVSANVEKYEPGVALFGGDDGLGLYKKMFQEMNEKAVDYDLVIGEFGFAQRDAMGELLSKYFDQNWRIENDLAGIERLFIIKKKC